MSHKKLAMIALLMIVVFGFIIFVYPLMFNPNATPAGKVDVAPPAVSPTGH